MRNNWCRLQIQPFKNHTTPDHNTPLAQQGDTESDIVFLMFSFVVAIAVDVVAVAFVVHVVVRFVLLDLMIYRYLFLYCRCRAVRVAVALLHMGLSGIGMPDVLGRCTRCKSP